MSDLKPKGAKLELNGVDYSMMFTLNVIDDIQTHFNTPIDKLDELLNDEIKNISNLKYILTSLINEGIAIHNDENEENKKEEVTERFIGRQITVENMSNLTGKIFESLAVSVPEQEDDELFMKNE